MNTVLQLLEIVHEVDKKDEVKDVVDGLVEQEEVKRKLVVPTNTVTNPETVVVKSLNTHLALLAVPRSILANQITGRADIFPRPFSPHQLPFSILIHFFSPFIVFHIYSIRQLKGRNNWSYIDIVAFAIDLEGEKVREERENEEEKGGEDGIVVDLGLD